MPKLLFVGIVERACRATVIREIRGISECFQTKDDSRNGAEPEIKVYLFFSALLLIFTLAFQLTTNGSNLRGMWEFASSSDESILEDDDIYSNDIYAILKTYGVEMARAAILQEMKSIFAVYSIDVNKRHLELIADYMVQ